MMFFLFPLFCHGLFAMKHSLMHSVTGSSGDPNISEFAGVVLVDGTEAVYCDSRNKILEPRQDWMKKIFSNDTQHLALYTQQCFEDQPRIFRFLISTLKQLLHQIEGVHILQRTGGCEWNENTGEVTGVLQYWYNGEGFLEFDLKTLTWIPLKPEAAIIKQQWDTDTAVIKEVESLLTKFCPEWLKRYLNYGSSFLQRTVLPSVSLLQKTSSSPVSCHATGFYPDRAAMFWRKDGEEIHEGVDHREILPNNDGTFQTTVNLNVSSVRPEDWKKYDCVFQLSGVENNIVTKLHKTVIRTNWDENNRMEFLSIIIVPVLILVAAVGFFVYKKKREKEIAPPPVNMNEFSEALN
ncbi:major histocompatibility complex class I-related gene protein-like [Oreochromis niloticus]|nr:major histocompatibility complex class I-related gene protein-like [Oreochromis niloticus]